MERLVKLQLVAVCTFQTSNSSPLSFGPNLQQATLSTAFTQSNRSCPRCGPAILATDFFQGQNMMQTRQVSLLCSHPSIEQSFGIQLSISPPKRARMPTLPG